jgi:hypothetical protein
MCPTTHPYTCNGACYNKNEYVCQKGTLTQVNQNQTQTSIQQQNEDNPINQMNDDDLHYAQRQPGLMLQHKQRNKARYSRLITIPRPIWWN